MQFSTKRVTEGLLAASLLAVTVCGAQAAGVTITGANSLNSSVPFAGYGTATGNNNVINIPVPNATVPNTGSGVTDPLSDGSLFGGRLGHDQLRALQCRLVVRRF